MVVYLPVDSCDLLENLYLCKVKHIKVICGNNSTWVVICLKICTFAR